MSDNENTTQDTPDAPEEAASVEAAADDTPAVEDVTGKGNKADPKVRKARARKSDKPTALEAIVLALNKNGPSKTMKVPDIIKAAVPMTNLKGEYPGQTIYSVIYSNAKKADALVEQVGKGEFKLTAKGKAAAKTIGEPKATDAPKAPARSRGRSTKKAAAAA